MATTYIEYDGTTTPAVDGINTDFTFPFPYLKIEDVRASINGVDETAFTINPATPTLLQFTAAPTAGTTVRIYRQTDPDAAPATFFAGSSVRAKDLNDNFDQILFIMQERQNFLQDLQLGQLPTGGLGTAALQDDAVTAAKLRDDVSIDGNRAVTTDHIRDNAVTSAKIADGTIVDADISASAEIAVSKLADGTARQLLQTDAAGTGVEWTSNVDVPGTLDVTGAATFDSTVTATGDVTAPSLNGGPLSGARNRIINGDMRIDQRNAGANVTPTADGATFPVDRWKARLSQSSKYSAQRNTGIAPSGFTDSLAITSLSAYSVASGDFFALEHSVEGFNMSDLAWGTASAKAVTLSFWVRSSLTGTFGGSIINGSPFDRSYPFTYTISAADTWEYKSIAISGPTSGGWNIDNTLGLSVFIGLGVGSSLSGTAGSWANSTLLSATGATSVVGTNGATFYITGVQLEPGTVATPFERRSYGQELALCQRYCVKYGGVNANEYVTPYGLTYVSGSNYVASVLPVEMRAAPTVTWSTLRWSWQGGSATLTALAVENASTKVCGLQASTAGGETAYRPGVITANSSTSAHLTFSAEL